ncbi:PD-(D/E)XK nuclease-like domain-containing protein [Vibrio anguillarum]|nr:PD-(D/E)XK nuclease-like domain-containing protein [Vibrio anguillarum]
MNKYINFNSPSVVLDELSVTPVVQSNKGFICKIPDSTYRAIPAHSKHELEPALETGVDYQYYSVNQNRKERTCMSDGQLLHLLALEPELFQDKYHVGQDLESDYSDKPLFFRDNDELKKFIAQHNQNAAANNDALQSAIALYSQESSQGMNSCMDFDSLPAKYRVGEIPSRSIKTLIEEYKTNTFQLIDLSAPQAELKMLVDDKANEWTRNHSDWVNLLISRMQGNDIQNKARLMNQIINDQAIEFDSLEDEAKIDVIPTSEKEKHYTRKSKQESVKNYLQQEKSDVEPFDTNLAVDKQIKLLSNYGYDVSLKGNHFQRIPNVGNKKSATQEYGIDDVISVIQDVYDDDVYFKPLMLASEKALAEKNNKTYITNEQYEHGKKIINALLSNEDASKILGMDGNEFEMALVWQHRLGMLCKAKADILNRLFNVMADIKFVKSADFNRVERDSASCNYHIQSGFYEGGFNTIVSELDGEESEELNEFYLIIVEKDAAHLGQESTKPIRVRVVHYDREDKERGEELSEVAIMRIHKWEETGVYDGFKGVRSIKVPVYQKREEARLIEEIRAEFDGWKPSPIISNSEELMDENNTIEFTESIELNGLSSEVFEEISQPNIKISIPSPSEIFAL